RLAENWDRANDQLQADRLIAPRGDNAWQTYENVLSEYFENARARAGIKEVAQRLEECVRAYLNSGQHGQRSLRRIKPWSYFKITPNSPRCARRLYPRRRGFAGTRRLRRSMTRSNNS
ncbi:MAG TPA: hypothetical protein VKB96_10100, partial [Gammaproteobacteria bacterium]|nr:hypothetical protein [Gammaproteobacteria bacterium]